VAHCRPKLSLSSKWLDCSTFNARSASIVLSGRNLWKQTKYRGVDPELGFNLTSGTDAPSDFQTMGPASYYIVRLNLGF
jgi:hypothetical protein